MIACPPPKLWLATQIAHHGGLTANRDFNLTFVVKNLDFAAKQFASFPGVSFIRKKMLRYFEFDVMTPGSLSECVFFVIRNILYEPGLLLSGSTG